MKRETKTFQLGDEVTWESQAAGSPLRKTGKIVEVVKVGDRPTNMKNTGIDRRHESYVVEVPGKTPKHSTKLYWPRVSQLTLVVKPAEAKTLQEAPEGQQLMAIGTDGREEKMYAEIQAEKLFKEANKKHECVGSGGCKASDCDKL